jgi:uncharacterized protein (DUF2267 family)
MVPNFNKFVEKGNQFINEVALELGHPEEKGRACRIMKAVLHTLRDKIPPQESLQLMAQLPMFIKAVYVDHWKWNTPTSKIRSIDDFIWAVEHEEGLIGYADFKSSEHTEKAIRAVFNVLKRHVSEGEMIDVMKTLPEKMRPLMA